MHQRLCSFHFYLLILALFSPFSLANVELKAVSAAEIGATIKVTVSGEIEPRSFLTIVPKDSAEGSYQDYVYVNKSGTFEFLAPAEPGDYELRLLGPASPYPTLISQVLKLSAASAKIEAPEHVNAGANFSVIWTGPDNPRDYITLGKTGANISAYITYQYTNKGSPVTFAAPDQPGSYELRYVLGSGDKILASRQFDVGAVSASINAPDKAKAGASIQVTWQGPNNPGDYITIVPRGAAEGTWKNYTYTAKGNPLSLLAPQDAGEYEIRYSTGQSYATLTSLPITITPTALKMGELKVVLDTKTTDATDAVEVILDASGSMLQKLEGKRRIDIAKQTLTHLTTNAIPPNTLFALRVFGREENSCQSDLEMPLAPLIPAEVSKKINAIEAKNNAKTPIGASLEKITEDLASSKGKKLVILLTDGEETCNGDPLATIEKLRKSGVDVHINIVGFAISDAKLQATFGHWAAAGAGQYYNANNQSELGSALVDALKPAYDVLDAQGQLVAGGLVGGAPIKLLPGNYTVQLRGQANRNKSVQLEEEKTAQVSL